MDKAFQIYVRQKLKNLCKSDKILILFLDEMHLKPFFDYKGGTIIGSAFNSGSATTSAFAFMVCSLFSSYKDAHILPTVRTNSRLKIFVNNALHYHVFVGDRF